MSHCEVYLTEAVLLSTCFRNEEKMLLYDVSGSEITSCTIIVLQIFEKCYEMSL